MPQERRSPSASNSAIKTMDSNLLYVTDGKRHLVCLPYSITNLHRMAAILGLKRHWFHPGRHPHYDIPKRRQQEIEGMCVQVSQRKVLEIIDEFKVSHCRPPFFLPAPRMEV